MDTGRVVLGLVFVLCTINSISTSDLDSMESLVELYSGAGQQPSTSGDDRYFGKHGTIQFEQVSTLNSMALAKTGDRLATRLRLKLATLQVILPCPPPPNAPSTRKNKESIMFPNCYRQCFPSSVEGFNDREYSYGKVLSRVSVSKDNTQNNVFQNLSFDWNIQPF